MAEPRTWALITSHGFVLIEVARSPDATVREIAERVGLTERQAHRVLSDLVAEEYIVRERIGRRNRYRINEGRPMRRAIFADRSIGELLALLAPKD